MSYSKCKWTPFAGMTVYGSVRRVTLRNEVVFIDGKVLAKPGSGKNIALMKQELPKTKVKLPIKTVPEPVQEIKSPKPHKTDIKTLKSGEQAGIIINQSGDSQLTVPKRVRSLSFKELIQNG